MNKRDLFLGMGLGAVIALIGMFVGGAAHAQVNLNQEEDGYFRVLNCRELHVKNAQGTTLVRVTARGPQPHISLSDDKNIELVRISSTLRGGGTITVTEHRRPMVTIGSDGSAGYIETKSLFEGDIKSAVKIGSDSKGGYTQYFNEAGRPVVVVPSEEDLAKQD